MNYVHISQMDGETPGAPWCNEPGVVIVTEDPREVTCEDCLDHVRSCELHWKKPPVSHVAPPIHQGTLVRSAGMVRSVLDTLSRLC